ncbi:MAG: hypothetical protein OEZ43_08870 [Gammaproteobacteria bacterium]|nr:hypothetical protein [Gammaproteobacteria bacterium]
MKILFVGDTRSHHSLREVITERSNIFYLMDAKKAIQQFDQLANGFEWLVFDNRILRACGTNGAPAYREDNLATLQEQSARTSHVPTHAIWYGYHSPVNDKNQKERKE